MRRPLSGILAVPIVMALTTAALGASYDEQRSAAVAPCEAIDPHVYQSGLLFNPDGYRSYFVRSECFQRVAREFRDASLCAQVRQRRSLFASSWGYSPSQCLKEVQAAVAADREVLEERRRQYLSQPLRLVNFRIERNGNGRDFDIVPAFTGGHAGSYTLRFDFLAPGGTPRPAPLHSSGMHLDGGSNVRLYVGYEDIRARWPEFSYGTRYTVRATLTLDVGPGNLGARWSDTFVEGVFPRAERFQALEKDIGF
jgi:hypothetical protein